MNKKLSYTSFIIVIVYIIAICPSGTAFSSSKTLKNIISNLKYLSNDNTIQVIPDQCDINHDEKIVLSDIICQLQQVVRQQENDSEIFGIYSIIGTDNLWGDYSGQCEIRQQANDDHKIIHTQFWNQSKFEEFTKALVWEGRIDVNNAPFPFTAELDTVGFILSYGHETRDAKLQPSRIQGELIRLNQNSFSVQYTVKRTNDMYESNEIWIFSQASNEHIWQNQRQLISTHSEIDAQIKESLFNIYSSFHQQPAVTPYIHLPQFQDGVHYQVWDRTDFDFYRNNPHIVRVIQHFPDNISFAEAKLRNSAYSKTLSDKAHDFDLSMSYAQSSPFINEYGMIVDYTGRYDIDSLEWTGVYVASQALRYMSTKEQIALNNMIHSLNGIILCYDIAPTKGDFARTIRAHTEPVDGNWVHGQGKYEMCDWLTPANNDMIKGFFIGFTFAYLALKDAGGDFEQLVHMERIIKELLEYNDALMSVTKRPVNTFVGTAMLLMMTQPESILDLEAIENKARLSAEYEALYISLKYYIVELGNGPMYEFGTSDWSGNQLNMETMLVLYTIAEALEKDPFYVMDAHKNDIQEGMRKSLDLFQGLNLGLFHLVYATLGGYSTPHPSLQKAIWILESFPCPKPFHYFDWRIHPEFCMSPFPELPWKFDWQEPSQDRTQSLIAYPLFEQNTLNYQWKANPFVYKNTGYRVNNAADYLIAYWFGRYHGVL